MIDKAQGALTEAVYYILLSLHTPMHGYGIMQKVSALSKGRLNLGPGTLYGAINSLVEKNWIQLMEEQNDTRKKEYVITELGKAIVQNEMERLEELIQNGRSILGGN